MTRPRTSRLAVACVVVGVVVATAVRPAHAGSDVTVDDGVPYVSGGSPNQTVDVYRPSDGGTGRVALVLVHGGGFAGGSPDDLDRQARLAARQGWVAFNLDYRTTATLGASGAAWPAELEDVQAGLAWVRENAETYGADPDLVAVLGASAGGTLAALASGGPPRAGALALWSAPTDLATLVPDASGAVPACGTNEQCTEFWRNPWVTNLLGCRPEECPDRYTAASPVAQAATLPASFIVNARSELVPLDQARSLHEALEAVGTTAELRVLSGARHAQTYADSVWNDTTAFLATQLGVPVPDPVDFDESPFGSSWTTIAIVVASIGIVVAVVLRVVSDRRREVAS